MKIYALFALAVIGTTADTAVMPGGLVRLFILVAFLAIGGLLVALFSFGRGRRAERDWMLAKRKVERAEREATGSYGHQTGVDEDRYWPVTK